LHRSKGVRKDVLTKYFKGIRKPTRLVSGVTVVALMTHPYPCPHGRCIYCPGGISEGTPQSYIDRSPVVMRARSVNYDPYLQVRERVKQYIMMGHTPSKVELIIMGGTFPAMPLDYQEWVITQALEALNRFPKDKPKRWISLEGAIRRNERAKIRCVGLTIETRPDWSKEKHVDIFLYLTATRIELGVQSIYDDVLAKVKRGHSVKDVIEATRILKDAGYKVAYHIMPGLPGSSIDRDYEMFVELFTNPDYRPDMLKIYPTLVMPGTELYNMWKGGKYKPYSLDELVELIAKVKSIVPPYVRIIRIQRDVPVDAVAAGLKIGNLREVVKEYMERRGIKCRCIRCREAGRYLLNRGELPLDGKLKLNKICYEASRGIEVFLSVENPYLDVLFGFLRLRIPSDTAHRREVDERTAIVRELHVYSPQVPVGEKHEVWWQHKGLGKGLLKEAERIALEEYDRNKILVISGIGVRSYYRKLGYRRYRNSFYMYKMLNL